MVIFVIVIVIAVADDLRLLQRTRYSGDAQNEHEKSHGNWEAHCAQVVRGATTALWLCRLRLSLRH